METKLKRNVNYKALHTKATVKKITGSFLMKVAMYSLLIGMTFVFLFPFLYMFTTSIKQPIDLMDMTTKWLVRNPNWTNYEEAIDLMYYWRALRSSIGVSLVSAIGQVLSCSFIAYGIARFKFPGKNVIFFMVIFSLIIPPQVLVIPLYIQYSNLGMMDTYLPIILPCFVGMGLRGGLFIFIFVQFYKGLPLELEEAARIDGCGVLRTYWNIILPVSKSSILVTSILSIVWHWNDYFEPSVFLMTPEKSLLSLAIKQIMSIKQIYIAASGALVNPMGMAGALLSVLPLVIMYLVLQKQFMAGVERSGLAN